uniref:Uncharacterized protein n=1 Tax=Anopheles coluzzii TaxID=1518534 RepID=A0A6E8W800_ANOCL
METDLAYEVLADYSLQETPFYEAPTPTAAVSVNFYPPPNDIQSPHQSGPQQSRSLNNTARCYDTAFDLSLTTSMLTGKMQLMNTGSATTSGPSVGAIGASGGIHQNNHQNQHQTGMALVPMGVSNLSSGSSLTSSICSGGNGEGLTRPKKMKKSVSFLPTFVQGCDGDSGSIQLKQEPLDDGPIRNIQKVPSLSDLSDPEASLVTVQVG